MTLSHLPLLSMVSWSPYLGVIAIMLRPKGRFARWAALSASLFTFVLSLLVWAAFDPANPGFQLVEKHDWLGGGIAYHLGVDGISVLFVVLAAGLMPVCIAASWRSIQSRVAEYMASFLILEGMILGVFSALDLVLFYVLFEGSLVPMFLIMGVWGGKKRVYASFKFILYTFVGSVIMLLAIMTVYWQAKTSDVTVLLDGHSHFSPALQPWLWLAFAASFAVKMPMWPFHTWLPDAYAEAPIAGSVVLASLLSKMGGYGFLRFSLPMFPDASHLFAPAVFVLSLVGIVYASLIALAQSDMKKVIGYSSIAHMGFVTMGIFTLSHQGIEGGVFLMLSHGVIIGALFLCAGVIFDRIHTSQISEYGGLANRMPLYAACFMIMTLANVGLPGTSGFVGELLAMLAAYQHNSWIAICAATGLILSAAYALYLYRRLMLGALVKPALENIADLTRREFAILAPLVAVTILLGLYPRAVLSVTTPAIDKLIADNRAVLAEEHPAAKLAGDIETFPHMLARLAGTNFQ